MPTVRRCRRRPAQRALGRTEHSDPCAEPRSSLRTDSSGFPTKTEEHGVHPSISIIGARAGPAVKDRALTTLWHFIVDRRHQLLVDSCLHVSAVVQAVLIATVIAVLVGVAVHR